MCYIFSYTHTTIVLSMASCEHFLEDGGYFSLLPLSTLKIHSLHSCIITTTVSLLGVCVCVCSVCVCIVCVCMCVCVCGVGVGVGVCVCVCGESLSVFLEGIRNVCVRYEP